MSLYKPVITITHISGTQYNVNTKIPVAAGEGVKEKSNTPPPSGSDERIIVFEIVNGPGGTISSDVTVNRAPSEKKVTVKVEDKDGKIKGEGSQEYD